MHLAAYEALGLAFTYVPFGITDLEGAIAGMRALGVRGLGISMPFKQRVIPCLDALDPVAQRIGAVNTVVNDGGKLTGFNTDWVGAIHALEEVGSIAGARVLLLGAGGAGRAVAFGLCERKAQLTIANRDLEKAESLAREVGARAASFEETKRARDYDIVVNATSVGMATGGVEEGASPIHEGDLSAASTVLDIVYKPLETKLICDARRVGARVVHGGRMLLHQAAAQFRLYTGVDAPLDVMDRALHEQMRA